MGLQQTLSYDISVTQQTKLSPLLQKATYLLSLNAIEISLEINQMLSQNIMLDIEDNIAFELNDDNVSSGEVVLSEDELDFDCQWEDFYEQDSLRSQSTNEPYKDIENTQQPISLRHFLSQQLATFNISPITEELAILMIDDIDSDGYLRITPQKLAESYQQPLHEIRKARKALQKCTPSGIAAYDLQECLLLQLQAENSNKITQYLTTIVQNHFRKLSQANYGAIQSKLSLSDSEFNACLSLLKSLNPQPGHGFLDIDNPYIEPEIFIKTIHGNLRVLFKNDLLPVVIINHQYAQMINHSTKKEQPLLKSQFSEAKWFINALDKRKETIQKICSAILKTQKKFFLSENAPLQSFTRAELAAQLNLHESTISRAVKGKYLQCNHGIYELSYFFSPMINKQPNHSIQSIKLKISHIIDQEDAQQPLSDQKITNQLNASGIEIARRTVAKYREELNISSAALRKKIKKLEINL